MKLFYTPDYARVGDVIPYWEDGEFKLFYLKNWNPYFGLDQTYGWHLLRTKDHMNYTETCSGIRGGTGCVIKVDGMYHLYYCIFYQNPQRQYICHATSRDMETWIEHPEETFGPDPSIYMPEDWRDPFVFWNEEEQCWWMIVCTQAVGATARRGCVGLCTSDDLIHWTCQQPIYAPRSSMSAYECPDLFKMGDWYYLVFSQFTDRFQTIYRMSRSPRGPWIRPDLDAFDSRPFYAAKSASDGQHRYLYGWNPSRTQNTWKFDPNPKHPGYDSNTWDWGGSLVVHELHQREDGTLAVKPIPQLKEKLPTPSRLMWDPMLGEWDVKRDGRFMKVESPHGYAAVLSRNMVPECARFHASFTYEEGTERIGIALQVNEQLDRGYYFYFEPHRQRIVWKTPVRMTGDGGWTFPWDVELERPLKLEAGKRYDVEIYIDDTIAVLYVNGDTALSTRMYDLRARKFALIVSDGSASFENVALYGLA